MEAFKKEITLYKSIDGKIFHVESECRNWEFYLKMNALHKKLLDCKFHHRFKIKPYFHNRKVETILGVDRDLHKSDCSYYLVIGRMGNGDDLIRYKRHGSHICILQYTTDEDCKRDPDAHNKYHGSIPSKWLDMDMDSLQVEVDEYLSKRRVRIRVKVEKVKTKIVEL